MEQSRQDLLRHYGFIPVVGRKGISFALVDARYAKQLAKYRWAFHVRGDGAVSPRAFIDDKWVFMRRWVAHEEYGAPPAQYVAEHLNGDLMDCRAENIKWSYKKNTVYQREKREAAEAEADADLRARVEKARSMTHEERVEAYNKRVAAMSPEEREAHLAMVARARAQIAQRAKV